jgi:dTDP-4-dehydrorhamnose 3,5-epimerase
MKTIRTALPEVLVVEPGIHTDQRGFFSETYNEKVFDAAGISGPFVQDNHAYSRSCGTLRGLHFQKPDMAQGKLVRVIRGSIFDVAVDIRVGSPRFGKVASAVLNSRNRQQFWVPVGFAHGYLTLEPDTEVVYKVTEFYSAQNDAGIAWNDPQVAIDWPKIETGPYLSEKDQLLPPLAQISTGFAFG